MNDKNTIIAIVLSAIVLLGWQYFIGMPQMEKQRQEAQLKQQQQQTQQAPAPTTTPAPGTAPAPGTVAQPGAPPAPGQASPAAQAQTREAVLAASPRIAIETPRLKGSIALKGARLDDLALSAYAEPVTLFPYALISRHGTPHTEGYYILHEGLIGVLGEQGLQEQTYKNIEEKKTQTWKVTNAWLGFTDKYWAATLLPDTNAGLQARYSAGSAGTTKTYQTDYLLDAQTIAPGAAGAANMRLFAGAKEVNTVDA